MTETANETLFAIVENGILPYFGFNDKHGPVFAYTHEMATKVAKILSVKGSRRLTFIHPGLSESRRSAFCLPSPPQKSPRGNFSGPGEVKGRSENAAQ